MIIISHRGNIDGVDPIRENSPEYIDEALSAGYDVEIDLRMDNGDYYLGHDRPQYKITQEWLHLRHANLWVHAKDFESCIALSNELHFCKWFAHNKDPYCLTSCGYIWLHDDSVTSTKDCVVPLLSKVEVVDQSDIIIEDRAHAICTDYPEFARQIRLNQDLL